MFFFVKNKKVIIYNKKKGGLMKVVALSLLFFISSAQAKTYFCSFADEKMGVLQIDIENTQTRLCNFQQQKNKTWVKVESGHGNFTNEYFDNNKYETMLAYEILTLKRDIRFSMPKNFKDGTKISVTLSLASKFGPLINSGYATGTSAICFYKTDAKPCDADLFKQPKNTPKNFEKLKRILETNERDWWGDRPTFTLVSPDLEDFEVFTLFNEQTIEACSFGCVSSKKDEIIQKRILPKLKSGWKIVAIYSNELGIEFFKTL